MQPHVCSTVGLHNKLATPELPVCQGPITAIFAVRVTPVGGGGPSESIHCVSVTGDANLEDRLLEWPVHHKETSADLELYHLCADSATGCNVSRTTVSTFPGTWPTVIASIIELPATAS